MADFDIVIENTWTHLKPNIRLNTDLVRRIEQEMSYSREEYSRFRKETIELDISLFEREQLRYPTGLYSTLESVLNDCRLSFNVIDARNVPIIGEPLKMHSKQLRDYQEEVVEKSIEAERGVIKVATGGGKTVIAAAIVARLNLKTLFIVYSIDLLEQTADEFEKMFQIKVGKIGGGHCDIKQINVCTIQTLHSAFDLKYSAIDEENMFKEKIQKYVLERKEDIRKAVLEADVVINDECHRATAEIYIQMARLYQNAYYRYSLCLHKKTKVLLADGRECQLSPLYYANKDKFIHVMTFNLIKKILEPKKARIIKVDAKGKRLFELIFEDENKEKTKIICAETHLFYVNDINDFKKAIDLTIGDKFSSVERIKRFCVCGKEIIAPHKYCSDRCKLKESNKIRSKKRKEWWNNLSEDEQTRRKSILKLGNKASQEFFKNLTKKDREKMSERQKKTMQRLKQEEPEKYERMYKNPNSNFSKPEAVSKRSKKIWSKRSKEERLRIISPMIISGLVSQSKLKREGVKRYAKLVKAIDGHVCDSKGEMMLDNWLHENNIKHEIHPNIPSTRCFADFKVKHEEKDFYLEYDGMDRIPYYKDEIYKSLNLNYLVLRRDDLTPFRLKQKLSFLLFQDPVVTLISKNEIENNEDFLLDLTIEDVGPENQNFFANGVLVHNSATPYRDKSIDKVLDAYSGRQICNIDASFLIERGFLVQPHIYMLDPNEHPRYKYVQKSFRNIYEDYIVNNKLRNEMIVDSCLRLLELGKSVLITVTRLPHGDILCEMLDKAGVNSVAFIQGEVDGEMRKDLLNKVRTKQLQVLVGSSVADEGVDIPALGSAIMAGGGKSLIKSLQRVGRTLRPYPSAENNEKKEAIIVDFYDRIRYLTGHSKKRLKIYELEPLFKVKRHF